MIRRTAAFAFLAAIYGLTWLIAVLGSLVPRHHWIPTGRIVVTGTFYNRNWYLSHIAPLTRSGVNEVIVVVDEPKCDIAGVRFVCPPKWAVKVLTRAGAKCLWMILAGIRYNPDLYMGYHVFPGACSALIAGSIFGRPTCYQMTGGAIEVVGGGYKCENRLLSKLGRSRPSLQRLVMAVIKQFELVVVRGRKAERFLVDHGRNAPVAIITAGIASCCHTALRQRTYDLVFVGRLTEIKQPQQFASLVAKVKRETGSTRAIVIGDGPLLSDLKRQARSLDIEDCIEFAGKIQEVESVLRKARVFILTSRSEGLSIALAEAMAAGVVPVVADVGELDQLVSNEVNGYVVEPDRSEEYLRRVLMLLGNATLWSQLSRQAEASAMLRCGIEVVAEKWDRELTTVIAHHQSLESQPV